MVRDSSEAVSKADPLESKHMPTGFFNLTSTAKEKVAKKRRKKGLGPKQPKKQSSLSQFYLLFGSSIAAKTLLMPLERIKTVLQVHHLSSTVSNNKPSGGLSVFADIVKNQGIGALWRGNMAMIYLNSMKMLTNIVFYDKIKLRLMPAGDSKYKGVNKYVRKTIAALITGTLTLGICYPFELMFTRITADMNGRGQNRLYLNTFDCFNLSMISGGGYRSLYNGALVGLVSIAPTTLLSLPLYETFKPMFDGLAQKENRSQLDVVLSRIGATSVAAIVAMAFVYPLDTIKRGMQVIGTRGYSNIDQTFMRTVNSIRSAFGVRGFYRGVHLAMIKTLPSIYLQLLVYDYLKEYTMMSKDHSKDVPDRFKPKEAQTSIISGETTTS